MKNLLILLFCFGFVISKNFAQKKSTIETLTDIDGNVYHSVKIGTQVWMTENLKTTKYRNGDSIILITDKTAWSNTKKGACCIFLNYPDMGSTYGKLYNWFAVMDRRNLAPEGWHIPTDADWNTLTNFLGSVTSAGGRLKETGTLHWKLPNTGSNNNTKFNALPGGYRNHAGAFFSLGELGIWWSSTGNDIHTAWSRFMSSENSNLDRVNYGKRYGFSVRCVKD